MKSDHFSLFFHLEVAMCDLYAKECGFPYFTVIDKGEAQRIYKFSYYWSNVGEAYVLVFSVWLPKEKRIRIPFDKNAPGAPKWKSPTIVSAMPWGVDSRPDILRIQNQLKTTGKINLDEMLKK